MASRRSTAGPLTIGGSALALLLAPAAASAHIQPGPAAIEAGSPATVSFTAGPPTPDQVSPAEGDDASGGDDHDGHHASESPDEPPVESEPDAGDADSGVSGGLIATAVGGVTIVAGVGILVSRRRRDTTG